MSEIDQRLSPESAAELVKTQEKLAQINSRLITLEHGRRVRVQRLGARSLAKTMGWLAFILGVLFEMAILFTGLLQPDLPLGFSPVLPLVMGVAGYVSGLVVAGIYNLVAQWLGGIELEILAKES